MARVFAYTLPANGKADHNELPVGGYTWPSLKAMIAELGGGRATARCAEPVVNGDGDWTHGPDVYRPGNLAGTLPLFAETWVVMATGKGRNGRWRIDTSAPHRLLSATYLTAAAFVKAL